jgi:hypothetical protein
MFKHGRWDFPEKDSCVNYAYSYTSIFRYKTWKGLDRNKKRFTYLKK